MMIKDLGMRYPSKGSQTRRYRYGLFRCENCNTEWETRVKTNLTQDLCLSCARMSGSLKHGDSYTRLHNIWKGMRSRCSTNKRGYDNISVCKEWQDYRTFKKWALANGYEEDLYIDRIDVLGDYTPFNCQWLTNGDNVTKGNTIDRLRKKGLL